MDIRAFLIVMVAAMAVNCDDDVAAVTVEADDAADMTMAPPLDDQKSTPDTPAPALDDPAPTTETTGATETKSDDGRFCTSSEQRTFFTSCRPCPLNSQLNCPQDAEQLSTSMGIPGCKFRQKEMGIIMIHVGCRHECRRTVSVTLCCPGHWGDDCQACPGGAEAPCGGVGVCDDGPDGNGTCTCQANYRGFACERCATDTLFGTNCDNECKCVHGVCDHGRTGNGACTCDDAFTGTHCDQPVSACARMAEKCHPHAVCQDVGGEARCVCAYGYSGDGTYCKARDVCLEGDHLCHENSFCVNTGPAEYECRCYPGFHGDGYNCMAVDPCQVEYGGCDMDTTYCVYLGPNCRECVCQEGFTRLTNVSCELEDVCALNSTLCHPNANCTTTGPGDYYCECQDGYVGDGVQCYGNMLERVRSLHTWNPVLRGRLSWTLHAMETVYTALFTVHGPFTFFAVTDDGYRRLYGRDAQMSEVFSAETAESSRQLLRQHLLAVQLGVDELNNQSTLVTLQGAEASFYDKRDDFRYKIVGERKNAKLVLGDVIAANGVIHVIDRLMTTPPNVAGSQTKSLWEVIDSSTSYSTFASLVKACACGLDADLANTTGARFTLFAPDDSAFTELLPGTMEYLTHTQGRGKLQEILRNHLVYGPDVTAADLVNLRRLTTLDGTAVTVGVTEVGRITVGPVNVTQTDIPASNGYIHHIDGLLLAEHMLPLLPQRCDLKTSRTVKGKCGPCHLPLKCVYPTDVPQIGDLPAPEIMCVYWVALPAGMNKAPVMPMTGCQIMCSRTFSTPHCCPGFYGDECLPCPGGHLNPCGGHGHCADSLYGDGTCECLPGFSGAACEFCADVNMHGPGCNLTCTCVHGECDSRAAAGGGACRSGTCQPGFVGKNCDLQASK